MQIKEAIENIGQEIGIVDHVGGMDNFMVSVYNHKTPDPSLEVNGGAVFIVFRGKQQPEMARTLDCIITPILRELGISARPSHRYTEKGTVEYNLRFEVPDDEIAGNFVEKLNAVTERIEADRQLKQQFQTGMELCRTIGKIPGAKQYVELNLQPGCELPGEDVVAKPPHFELKIDGVPEPLAKKLAGITGQSFSHLPASIPRTDHQRVKKHTNPARNFSIAVTDGNFPAVKQGIEEYVGAMRTLGHGYSSGSSASLGGSPSL